MSGKERKSARKPVTKFPKLRKKMQKSKAEATKAKKNKRGKG